MFYSAWCNALSPGAQDMAQPFLQFCCLHCKLKTYSRNLLSGYKQSYVAIQQQMKYKQTATFASEAKHH